MNKKGFTLLYASLIVSLILSISLAIANLTLSQFTLSSAGRESQFAFYNADSGIECALYQENKVTPFPTSYSSSTLSITCDPTAGVTALVAVGKFPTNQNSATTTTTYEFNPTTSCQKTNPISFTITVNKGPVKNDGSRNVHIESRGYNTCDSTNPRRVERGLYIDFIN